MTRTGRGSMVDMLAEVPVTETKSSLISSLTRLLRVLDVSEGSIMIPTLLKDKCEFDANEMLTLAKILKASILGHNDLVEFYMSESSRQLSGSGCRTPSESCESSGCPEASASSSSSVASSCSVASNSPVACCSPPPVEHIGKQATNPAASVAITTISTPTPATPSTATTTTTTITTSPTINDKTTTTITTKQRKKKKKKKNGQLAGKSTNSSVSSSSGNGTGTPSLHASSISSVGSNSDGCSSEMETTGSNRDSGYSGPSSGSIASSSANKITLCPRMTPSASQNGSSSGGTSPATSSSTDNNNKSSNVDAGAHNSAPPALLDHQTDNLNRTPSSTLSSCEQNQNRHHNQHHSNPHRSLQTGSCSVTCCCWLNNNHDPDVTLRLLIQIEQLKTFIPQVTNLFESIIELYTNSVDAISQR